MGAQSPQSPLAPSKNKSVPPASCGRASARWGGRRGGAGPARGCRGRSAPSAPPARRPPGPDPPAQTRSAPTPAGQPRGTTLRRAGLWWERTDRRSCARVRLHQDSQSCTLVSNSSPPPSHSPSLHLCLRGDPKPASLSAESAGLVGDCAWLRSSCRSPPPCPHS